MFYLVTRQLSFFREWIRGVRQCQASNLSRVATQWHGWELNPQHSCYEADTVSTEPRRPALWLRLRKAAMWCLGSTAGHDSNASPLMEFTSRIYGITQFYLPPDRRNILNLIWALKLMFNVPIMDGWKAGLAWVTILGKLQNCKMQKQQWINCENVLQKFLHFTQSQDWQFVEFPELLTMHNFLL